MFFPIAEFSDILPFFIPITALMIPIIAILVKHQQQMAQIIHGSQKHHVPNPEIDALRREVQELKQILHQQAIALDGLQNRPAIPDTVSQRFTEV